MIRRLAVSLAISVIASQTLVGAAFAAVGEGFGNPYVGRGLKNYVSPDRGICESSETLYLFTDRNGSRVGCTAGDGDTSEVLFSGAETPIRLRTAGDLVISLGDDDTDTNTSFRGLAMEITIGGNVIFDANEELWYAYGGKVDRRFSITVTQTGIEGFGLENVKVLRANSVRFNGSDENETFDASALSVDIGQMDGGGGNDILKGGSGNDIIDSGAGNDTVFAGPGDDNIVCDAGGDKEACWGGPGDDVLDVAWGGVSEITIAPGDGADEINFPDGGGRDAEVTMYYGDATVGQEITLAERVGHGGKGDACEDSDFGEDTASGRCGYIISLVGSPKADVLDASGVSMLDFLLVGGPGNDYLIGANGTWLKVLGGAGDDKIFAGLSAAYYLSGGSGNDRIVGGDGVDYISGGAGDDTIFAGTSSAPESISVSFGPDSVSSSGTITSVRPALTAPDVIWGGRGDDIVYGEGGNDRIKGGMGADRLSGGSGDDTVTGSDGNDQLHGDTGNDLLRGMRGNDRAWGDSDSYADGGDGDFCSAETIAGCEWSLATGPAGPYWVKLQL